MVKVTAGRPLGRLHAALHLVPPGLRLLLLYFPMVPCDIVRAGPYWSTPWTGLGGEHQPPFCSVLVTLVGLGSLVEVQGLRKRIRFHKSISC